ncbi:maltose permease [Scheffersomyces coipomensis]|uniref:maltose permease n=1 Tax=Scheffersomyces coipomensis TaxID=1788519 RepID=UPI00315C62FC
MSAQYVEDVKNPNEKVQIEPLGKKGTDSSSLNSYAVDDYVSKFLDMSNEAKDNDHKEKTMKLREGIKTFPKAVMWSLILSSALIMEGYDTNLLNSFFGFPAFNKKFGNYYPELGEYQVPARWQTGLNMGYNCGCIVGLAIAGYVADVIGYRKTMMSALATSVALIFLQFFSPNREVLLLAYVLLGINWGSYQTLTVTYASEVAPTTLRVYLTTYVNLCWVFGQLLSSGILKAMTGSKSPNAYRIPFAIQWIWPIPIFIGVFFAPESPWYLVKKGRDAEAKQSLKRLLTENSHLPDKEVLATAMLKKIQMTVKEEEAVSTGITFRDCFRGSNFRRTRIAAFTWMFQSCTGSTLMGYSTYFYIQAGLSTSMSFTFSIIQYIIGIIGTVGSWFVSKKVGRFNMYFFGLCFQSIVLIIVGGLGCSSSTSAKWGVGSLLLIYTFVYDLTVGPMCYCIVAEIPNSRLRTKTVMLARNLYNVSNIIVGIVTPYMLNPTQWNWKAKTGFFWAGFSITAAIWCYFDLPETKGRTFAELDLLFEEGIKARKFKSTEVDVFNAGKLMERFGEENIKAFVQEAEITEEKIRA